MTMKFTTSRMENTIRPMTTSPPIRKPPNAATTWPAASGPSLPCDRISRVVATLSDRRSRVVSSSRVGKEVKVERAVQEQRDHQHQHGGGDGERQAEIQQQRRQRQDQHGEQGHHAEREADVAAGREPARAGGEGCQEVRGGDGAGHGLPLSVMAGLDPAIHARPIGSPAPDPIAWMTGSSPAMTRRTSRRRHARGRRRHGDALGGIVAQLVAQRADRDAEDRRGVRAVAQGVARASR